MVELEEDSLPLIALHNVPETAQHLIKGERYNTPDTFYLFYAQTGNDVGKLSAWRAIRAGERMERMEMITQFKCNKKMIKTFTSLGIQETVERYNFKKDLL